MSDIIRDAIEQQRLSLPRRELNWLKRIEKHLTEYSTEA